MYMRPGLKDFLNETSKHFELILFNNGSQLYTDAVVDKLIHTLGVTHSQHYFSHVLCREQCSTNDKGHEIKNLEFFTGDESNRDIKDCIIVDNSIFCYQRNITNGLFVPNYNFMDKNDEWLKLLAKYLIERFTQGN
jgi:TFIIF-interacting CTD phosphatase-like protein